MRVIITAGGYSRDWTTEGETFTRAIALELSEHESVSVLVEKDSGSLEYLYLDGIESVFETID